MIPDWIEKQHFDYIDCNIRLKPSKEANEARVHNSKVVQELRTLPEHMSSSPVFSGIRVTRSLVFCVMMNRSLFVLFVLYLLVIVLSVFTILITPLVSSNSS
jgi:hypothetical protein